VADKKLVVDEDERCQVGGDWGVSRKCAREIGDDGSEREGRRVEM